MEEKKSKGYKRFKFVFVLLLIIFGMLYVAGKTGYYERNTNKNTILTKEAIIAFEKDVSDGKPVDIKDYINENTNNYENNYSILGHTISEVIETIINDSVKWIIKFLESLFS